MDTYLDGPALQADPRTWFDDVLEFYRDIQGGVIPPGFALNTKDAGLYEDLIKEELQELKLAVAAGDAVALADAYCDVLWVLIAQAIARGIDLRPCWAEVARSNHAKLGGPRRADGKLLKPADWRPPDIAGALRRRRM